MLARSFLLASIAAIAAGCDCSAHVGVGTPCTSSAECADDQWCVDGMCQDRPDDDTDAGPNPTCSDDPETAPCRCDDPSCVAGRVGVGSDNPFTLDEDENNDSDGVGLDDDGALILDSTMINTNVIWVANTGEGTVSKLDTNAPYTELARYVTGPLGSGGDPSRTSVNSSGDVFVGNRGGHSVTRISALGDDCPDTNGDGVITTSHGPTEVLPWGQDDCALWNRDLPGTYIRSVAAQDVYGLDGTLLEYVWIGDWNGPTAYKIDGRTGDVLITTPAPVNTYGFALDGDGQLWISSLGTPSNSIGRIDTTRCLDDASCADAVCEGEGPPFDDCIKQRIPAPHGTYGITVDFRQRVFVGGSQVGRYDHSAPVGARWQTVAPGAYFHGIAADAVGWVWAAGYDSGVFRVNADDLTINGYVAGSQYSAKGMAVDQDGKIWTINQGHSNATVIVPGDSVGAEVVTAGVGTFVAPYTYSDMTGLQLRLATNPRGWYRRIFEGCESPPNVATTEWRLLFWDADVPPGTALHFRVRTAASRDTLEAATWINVANVPPDSPPANIEIALATAGITPERIMQVEVMLESSRDSITEVITPRVRSFTLSHACVPIIE